MDPRWIFWKLQPMTNGDKIPRTEQDWDVLKEALAIYYRAEWEETDDSGLSCCPDCHNGKRNGHKDSCELNEDIATIKALLETQPKKHAEGIMSANKHDERLRVNQI